MSDKPQTNVAAAKLRPIVTQGVMVPDRIPGFTNCEVIYNVMAPEAMIDQFMAKMGGDGSHVGVVVEVKGYPTDLYGDDPWSKILSPAAFRAWATRAGWGLAIKEFISAPN